MPVKQLLPNFFLLIFKKFLSVFLLEDFFIAFFIHSFIYPFTCSTNIGASTNPMIRSPGSVVAHIILVAKSEDGFGRCDWGAVRADPWLAQTWMSYHTA